MKIRKLIITLALSLFYLLGVAQEHTVGFGLGGAAFRGETSDNLASVLEEIGVQSHIYYALALKDARWQLMAQVNYNRINADIDITSINGDLVSFSTASQHFFGSLGMRFYFDQRSRRYLPRFGQSAPFLGAHVGGVLYTNETNSPFFSDGDNIDIKEGASEDLAFQVEAGYRFYLNQNWSMEANANFRHGANDLWDGIGGHTEFNDWIISLSLGFAIIL
jgi:hypothetical protein